MNEDYLKNFVSAMFLMATCVLAARAVEANFDRGVWEPMLNGLLAYLTIAIARS